MTQEALLQAGYISDALWAVYGSVRAELPCNLRNASIYGKCSVGAFTYLGWRDELGSVSIGRYCSVAQDVIIAPGEHCSNYVSTHPVAMFRVGTANGLADRPEFQTIAPTDFSIEGRWRGEHVEIGHDVWIGARAIILGGVKIGHGAIIGAGAVVTKDVEPYAVVAGNPARVIRYRLPEAEREALLKLQWWDYDLSVFPERDYSDVPAFIAKMERAINARRVPHLAPAVAVIEAGQVVSLTEPDEAHAAAE